MGFFLTAAFGCGGVGLCGWWPILAADRINDSNRSQASGANSSLSDGAAGFLGEGLGMVDHPLEYVWAKIERPDAQIKDLESQIRAFFTKDVYGIAREPNADHTQEVWKFVLKKRTPRAFVTIIGEILHNMRSALDQLMCAIAVQHSGSSRGTYFPLGKTQQIFESELSEKTKKMPSDARDLIRALKPYPGGNDLLWALHDLNRGDKHASKITTRLKGLANIRNVMVWAPKGALSPPHIITLGLRSGRHFRRVGRELVQSDPEKQPRYTPNPASVVIDIGATAMIDDSMEFMTTDFGADVQTEIEPLFDIVFQDVQGLEGESVVAGLHQMRSLTESITLLFGSRFFL